MTKKATAINIENAGKINRKNKNKKKMSLLKAREAKKQKSRDLAETIENLREKFGTKREKELRTKHF